MGEKKKKKESPKVLTEQVDNAFVVSSKEPDGVFEEEHEGCIDDSISQLIGVDLRKNTQSAKKFSLKLPWWSATSSENTELPVHNLRAPAVDYKPAAELNLH